MKTFSSFYRYLGAFVLIGSSLVALAVETPPMLATTFYRAINMNGSAVTLDGNSWVSSTGASNFSFTGTPFANQTVTLNPGTDATRASMIRSSVYGNVTANMSAVPSGYYKVYIYVWEDNSPETITINVEGTAAVTNYNTGSAGAWAKLGPFLRNVTDGTLNIATTGGSANVSGIEVWSSSAPPVVANAIPDHVAVVNEAFNYTLALNAFTDPDAGTTLTLSAAQSNGSALPSWLTFNASTRKFSGTALTANLGTITVRVTATDGDTSVSDDFTLTVVNGFYRAVDLFGSAITIDGNAWEGNTTTNFTSTGPTNTDQSITLTPSTDANRATMIRSSLHSNATANFTSVPNGLYDVYIYVWEDSNPTPYSITLEGSTIVSNASSGLKGEWSKLGPFRRTISDGAINIVLTGGVGMSGIEVRRASTGEVPLTVNIAPQNVKLAVGQAAQLNKAVLPDNGSNQTVNWASSNTAIATVSSSGLVRAVSVGTATITATSTLGAYSGTSTITVIGAGANMIANPEFDNGMSSWYITDVAGTPANSSSVVQNASLSGANALYVDIANTNVDIWRYQVFTTLAARLEVGKNYRISFMAKSQANRNLTATLCGSSSNMNYSYNTVAVTAAAQTFSVNFTCSDANVNNEGGFYFAFYAGIGALNDVWIDKVIVEDVTGITQVSSVSVSPTTLNLTMGSTGQLTKTISPSNATNQTVTWTSSNPSVATVNATGLVTAVATGTTTVTVQTENGGKVANASVNVSGIAVTGITAGPANVNIPAGNTLKLTPVIAPVNATNKNVNWVSANTAIATVDANGVVTAVSQGLTTITGTTVSGGFKAVTNIYVLPAAADFIVNGEFNNGTTVWQLVDTTTPLGAGISVVTNASMSGTNALRVDVQNSNNEGSALQLKQQLGRRLRNGMTYRITFLAKAESNRQVTLVLSGASATYFSQVFDVTTTAQRFTVDYTSNSGAISSDSQFFMKVYLANGVVSDVWLDDVTMMDVTPYMAATDVTVAPSSATLSVGEILQITPNILPVNATNIAVSWSSSSPAIASVSSTGAITAAGVGSAVITANTLDGNHTKPVNITVTAAQVNSLSQVLENFAFQYKYDGRKRMTQKKVPGADWVYMVYDDRDRLVLTQDGEQRKGNKWTFTKYDALNRPVLTGIYTNAASLDVMQSAVDNFYAVVDDPGNTGERFETTGGTVHGYTNNSFPGVTDANSFLTATYYDDYAFKSGFDSKYNYDNNQLTASGGQAQESTRFERVIGQVTGAKVKNLETNDWYWTINYYDDHYRVIQSISDNVKGGTNKLTNVYDFVGEILRTKNDHSISTGPIASTERRMVYDHVGRLLQTDQKTDVPDHPSDLGFVTLAKNQYNELGQLVTKGLHSTDNGATVKQQVDYRYNVRGWLTRINDSELSSLDGGPKDFFGMNLGYDNSLALSGGVGRFNGNISAIKYSSNLGLSAFDPISEIFGPTERGYAFSYDALNRLENADHHERKLQWDPSTSYDERGIQYDLNGNIQLLSRSGKDGSAMDALGYTYRGNQLVAVLDNDHNPEGFKDENKLGTDYLYDKNGRMTTDLNKGISLIIYNHLNLPSRVQKNTGEYVRYYYDATGGKLRQEVYNASNVLQKRSDYVGEYFYENDTLRFINHEEGRIVVNEGEPEYQYMLKDHLGNVRVTFTGKTSTETFTATMEEATQAQEQNNFNNYNSTLNDLFDHTDEGDVYNRSLVLNGGVGRQIGLAKSFSVSLGDKISAKVYAKYLGTSGSASGLGNFATALVSAFGLTPPGAIDAPGAYAALNDIGVELASGLHPDVDQDAPKAFLNMLIFDKNYKLVEFAFKQVHAEFEQIGVDKSEDSFDELIIEKVIGQEGYVYLYLSNEEPNELQVGFDDYEVKREGGGIVQLEEYYPFGLAFNSYSRENSTTQEFKYNGKEEQNELSLGWLDYGWRMYDPAIARWHAPDPFADKFMSWSPYNYVANNPVIFLDPDGRIIEGDVDRVEDLKDEANRLKGVEAKRQAKLQNKIDKRSAAGKSTALQERRMANSKERVNQIDGALNEISAMERSETVYYINSDYQEQPDGTSGETRYENGKVMVNVSKSYGLHGLAHELKHAYQFESRQLDFYSMTGQPGLLYDIGDEVAAFKRQFAFNSSSLGSAKRFSDITPSFVSKLNAVYNTMPQTNLNACSKLLTMQVAYDMVRKHINFLNGNPANAGVTYEDTAYSNLILKE
ncbi:MAG: Ig-like domain-containing protein [Chryseolinea sp.]